MTKTAVAIALTAPVLGLALIASPASASGSGDHHGSGRDNEVLALLDPVPGSGVEGRGVAEVEFDHKGHIDEFEVAAKGLLADAPHAAHIHFGEEAAHECPTLALDADGSGTLSTSEGVPAYGPVALSLTTRGDTSPDSVLAIDRYDTATDGTISYQRTGRRATADGVAEAIARGEGVVVIHGVDRNGSGAYDGDAKSDLDASLPAEATDPALCGVLEQY